MRLAFHWTRPQMPEWARSTGAPAGSSGDGSRGHADPALAAPGPVRILNLSSYHNRAVTSKVRSIQSELSSMGIEILRASLSRYYWDGHSKVPSADSEGFRVTVNLGSHCRRRPTCPEPHSCPDTLVTSCYMPPIGMPAHCLWVYAITTRFWQRW